MKTARLKLFLLLTLISSAVFAFDEGRFGLSEESTVAARKTLMSVRGTLDDTMRIIEGIIYPNLMSYGVNPRVSLINSDILMSFTASTNNVGTLASSVASKFDENYTYNPYINQLVILESGLKVQMKFIPSNQQPQESHVHYNIPMFEPLFNKRIILIPIMNIAYDSNDTILVRDQEIQEWECLTDADSGVVLSGSTIAEGMRSFVAMGGGILGTCQYISPTNLDLIWKTI